MAHFSVSDISSLIRTHSLSSVSHTANCEVDEEANRMCESTSSPHLAWPVTACVRERTRAWPCFRRCTRRINNCRALTLFSRDISANQNAQSKNVPSVFMHVAVHVPSLASLSTSPVQTGKKSRSVQVSGGGPWSKLRVALARTSEYVDSNVCSWISILISSYCVFS